MRALSDNASASASVLKGRRREGKHVVVVVTCLGVCASDLRCRESGRVGHWRNLPRLRCNEDGDIGHADKHRPESISLQWGGIHQTWLCVAFDCS